MAQRTVSGKVTGESNEPLAGATVSVKGTKKQTVTDRNGTFRIDAEDADILLISNVGYFGKEVKVSDASAIVLASNAQDLSEVVVTALGIRKETKKLTYAIQEVKTADLVKAREPNPINSLKGKVAGLNVNINNELLRQPSINFRGEGNILFVVDGVPITTDTWNISPDDIESYTFLKGQAASALYGSLARNGAIVINTKKGTKDKRGVSIEFNSSTMFDKGFLAFPIYQDEYGPGSRGKYAFKDGIGGGLNDNDYDVWGPRFDGQLLPQYDGQVTPGTIYTTTFADGSSFTGNIKPTPWTARGKDNLKKFLQTGILSTNHISIAASGDKYDLRFGIGHTYQKAIVPNMDMNTTNFNLSAGYDFTDKIRLTADINYSRQYSPNFPDVNYGPNSMIYNVVIWAGADWSMDDMSNYWQPGKIGLQQIYAEYQRYNNPWFMVNEWLRPHYKNDVYGYVSLNWKFAKNFELMYRPGVSTYNIFRQEKMPVSAGSYGRDERLGDYREDTRSFFEANNEVQVKYNSRFFNNFLSVDGFAGGNIRTARYNGNFASTDYLNIPGLYTLANSLRPPKIASISLENIFLSAYYSFDFGVGKYLSVNTTGRVDKSSTLPLENNTFFYPSFGVSTAVTDYVRLPKTISFLKFRGSYAEGRNAGIYATIGQPTISIGSGQGYGQQYSTPINMGIYDLTSIGYNIANTGTYNNALGASYTNGLLDPALTADNKKTVEIGMDIRFLKNRLNLDVAWFNSKSELLSNRTDIISQASGYDNVRTNYGSYKNTGMEIALSGFPISGKEFTWNVNVNWATFKRTWIKNPSPNAWSKDGSRLDLVYDEGFIRTPDGQVVHGTDGLMMRFRDAGQGGAKRIFGHADPDWSWGITNTFGYKGFRFSFQFDGVVGGVLHDYVRQKTLQGGRHLETATGLWGENRVNDISGGTLVVPGVVLTGGTIQLDPVTGEILNFKDLTVSQNANATSVQNYSSRYASILEMNMIDKTFGKLREVTLTYQLPATLLGKSFIKKAEVSFVGRNLLLFFPEKYKDVDPDQFTQSGASDLQTPTTRRFGFNVNLTF
ncbi:MAG: SusC/RagA family TonB-linked outer membrane protein [Bacteroidota bacterium]